jgi:FkbM family methyltransferase
MLKRIARRLAFEVQHFPERVLASLPSDLKYRRGMIDMESSIANAQRAGFTPASIIDIGAYHGDWSRMVRRIYPNTPIFMLEANPEMESHIAKAAVEVGNAKYRVALLGPKPDPSVLFHVMETGSSVFADKSLMPRSATRLSMTTLDEVLSKAGDLAAPHFLKLDVQGYELEVLRGAERVLAKTEVALLEVSLIEFNEGAPLFAEVVAFMAARGLVTYDLSGFSRRESDRALFQVDLLFARESSVLRSKRAFWKAEAKYAPQA